MVISVLFLFQLFLIYTAKAAQNPIGACIMNSCPKIDGTYYGCYKDNMCYISARLSKYGCHYGETVYNGMCLIFPDGPPCEDKDESECQKQISLCTNPSYHDLMKKKCRKTCNFCTPKAQAGGVCADKVDANGVSDCPNRANLCTDPAWEPIMKSNCPKTCGFCH